MQYGSRAVFTGYSDHCPDHLFKPGCFLVIAGFDGDGIPVCMETDETGRNIWWQPQTLFPEEMILLTYAPPIPRSRIPAPYGDLVGQPW